MTRRMVIVLVLVAGVVLAGEVREWKAKSGKTISAELVSYVNGKVTLRTPDGRTATIDSTGLSTDDQAYLDGLAKAGALPKPAAATPSLSELPGVDKLEARVTKSLPWLIAIVILNIPLAILWGKFFFGGWAEFFECVRYKLTPDFVSMMRGEWGDDLWAEWKLGIFTFWCIGTTVAQLALFLIYVSPHLG